MVGFILSFIATLAASFSGGGASLILFPLLLSFVDGSYTELFVIAKIAALFMTLVAGRMHFKKSKLDIKMFLVLVIGGLLGTAVGTYFLQFQFNETLFKTLLVIFIFVVAIYLLFSGKKGLEERRGAVKFSGKIYPSTFIFSFFLNIPNGIFGGTGIFVTVFLVVFAGMSYVRAIGYTMAMYAVISLLQTGYLVATESFDIYLGMIVVVGAVLGGFAGTKLQYLKGNLWVKRAAILMMLIIGIKLLSEIVAF